VISGFFPGAPLSNPGHLRLAPLSWEQEPVEPSGLITLTAAIVGTTDLVPTFDKGDRIKVTVVVIDPVTDDYVNPSGLILRVLEPHGQGLQQSIPPTMEATGRFYAFLDLDTEGKWRARWEADGANEPIIFLVRPTSSD
jgi:hypothetical protein